MTGSVCRWRANFIVVLFHEDVLDSLEVWMGSFYGLKKQVEDFSLLR